MSNGPAIPAEIAREVLIESGHRCAVCGAGCPLERAHIIPWHKSREHKAEDLICLCANCHQRADLEKWGEKTLREYKRRPWVMRQYENMDSRPGPTSKVTIELELEHLDEKNQRLLQYAIASFLETSPNTVRIASIERGSVKVTIELPTESAERLLNAYKRNDSELVKYLAPLVLVDLHREEAGRERIQEAEMQASLQRFQGLYEQGEQHLQRREWEEAIEVFLEIVGLDAGYKDSVNKLRQAQVQKRLRDSFRQGKAYYDGKNWQEAIEVFRDIRAQDPHYPEVQTLLSQAEKQQQLQQMFQEGEACLKQENWKKARSKFMRIKREDPSYPGLAERLQESQRQLELQELYNQGRASITRRDWAKAWKIFRELQAQDPDYRDVNERLEEANSHWEEQKRLDRLYATARNYEREENWQGAHDAYVEILRLDPDYGDVTKRVKYVARQKRSESGINTRWSLWERWRSQSLDVKIKIYGLIIAVAGLIVGCGILTPAYTKLGDLLFGHRPVPTLVSPIHGASLVKEQSVTLEWEWDGERDIEFEVRMRPKGNGELLPLARVREQRYVVPGVALQGPGEYEWQIVALSRKKEYSSKIWSFKWE